MSAPLRSVFSVEERVTIKHHLGYPNVSTVQTFVLGVPAGVETNFLIEGAMDSVEQSALPRIRKILAILETIEAQQVDDLELLAVNRLDTIEVNQSEQSALVRQYDRWVNALGNALGAIRNPFDQRVYCAPGGINVGVQG